MPKITCDYCPTTSDDDTKRIVVYKYETEQEVISGFVCGECLAFIRSNDDLIKIVKNK